MGELEVRVAEGRAAGLDGVKALQAARQRNRTLASRKVEPPGCLEGSTFRDANVRFLCRAGRREEPPGRRTGVACRGG
jgi:hypothetical protein